MTGHALVVRLDSLGDVVVSGPAIRAVAAGSDRLTVLVGPRGADVAALLPGVDAVEVFDAPWVTTPPPVVDPSVVDHLVRRVRALQVDRAVVLTSFHQNALPTALLLRLAGVRHITAVSTDYAGSLLDVRVPEPPDAPESVRMATIAAAAGFATPSGDDGRPALRVPVGASFLGVRPPGEPYVVVHPGAAAPSRELPAELAAGVVAALGARGRTVLVTGTAAERSRNRRIARATPLAVDLTAELDVGGLAAVLAGADAVVCGNSGPAHLAAAAGTPVVSVFAPVVPARRWAPVGAAVAVLGDQAAACRGTRARQCPVPGHPCVGEVSVEQVLAGLDRVVESDGRVAAAGRPVVPA